METLPSNILMLDNLTEGLNSSVVPFQSADNDSLLPPTEGISLLDVKSELLLSYIQDLVSLIILRLRVFTAGHSQSASDDLELATSITKHLIELRIYTEKGVRPLENRLKYQVDKVIKAADDAERGQILKKEKRLSQKASKQSNGVDATRSDESGGTFDSESNEEAASEIDELSFRPNPAALMPKHPVKDSHDSKQNLSKTASSTAYRPPRIQPTAMPDLNRRDDRRATRPQKSAVMDEYVADELSAAPIAQPSIGAGNTIADKGRKSMGRRERDNERERREYEETNFMRLAGESKAERKSRNRIERQRGKAEEYGGEDLSGLGSLSDRIALVTRGSRESRGLLARSRKRGAEDARTDNGGRGKIGESFEKRRKILEGREARRNRKGR
ncbi:MAG: hypothetical protein Q9227_005290 [Pyrenula ochraceoflavens]